MRVNEPCGYSVAAAPNKTQCSRTSAKRPLSTSSSFERRDAEFEATQCSHGYGRFQERTAERAEQILSDSHASALRANTYLRRTQGLTLSNKASLLWLSPVGIPGSASSSSSYLTPTTGRSISKLETSASSGTAVQRLTGS